nr:uncharacterized protein LOC108078037 [Drosophila kikkawai]
MELHSRLLLIAGLLMLSWHWAAGVPRSPPVDIVPTTTHQENLNNTTDFNTSDVFVQSIFEINPTCRPGYILVGRRCHKMA